MKSLLIAGLLTALSINTATADTVRMGTEGAYPPYNFINDKKEVDGFERHLGDELCKRVNLTCVWVVNEWDSIIPNLLAGNYDTIIAGMSITEERDKVIDFTQAYYPPAPAFYVARDGANANLKSRVIAAQTGTIQAGHVAATGATLVEFATPDETIADDTSVEIVDDGSSASLACTFAFSLASLRTCHRLHELVNRPACGRACNGAPCSSACTGCTGSCGTAGTLSKRTPWPCASCRGLLAA